MMNALGIRFRKTAIACSCLLFTLAVPSTTLATVSPPTLVVERLTDTTPTSVTFNLQVTRNGAPAGVSVEYGTDTGYGTIVGTVDDPEATDGTRVVAIPIINLTAGTVYHYRVIAGNSAGQVMTEDRTFTAGNHPPLALDDEFIRRDGAGPFELPVLANDFDLEQRPLEIISITQGAHGAVTITNGGAAVAYQLLEDGFAGDDTFTYTIADGSGATDTAAVLIHLGRLPVVTETLFITGDPVPGAGEAGSAVPAGARFGAFGFPAINDHQQMAFSARILSPGHPPGNVIIGPDIRGNIMPLVVSGQVAPDEQGKPLRASFTSFLHPLLNDAGDIAFIAGLAGPRVHPGNDLGIWVMENGQLRLIAREGDRARGVPGSATFKSFKSVALANRLANSDGDPSTSATVAFVGQLTPGHGGVTETNDLGLWRYKRGALTEPALQLLLREGALFDFHAGDNIPGRIVRSFTALEPQRGAAGHGSGFGLDRHSPPSEDLLARIRFVDGEEAIAEFGTGPQLALRRVGQSNDPDSTHPYARFGIPTQSANGQNAFLATLLDGEDVNAESNPEVVFVANDLDTPSVFPVASEGDPAPSVEGAQFADFHQVVNNGEGSYAFGATVAGPGIHLLNDKGIWFNRFTEPVALAREGGDAPGVDGGKFTTFLSLAMRPDGGAIFTALAGEPRSVVGRKGVWFTDDDSALRLAIKEGDRIDGGVHGRLGRIRSLSILEHVIGSPAQTRSFNNRGDLIYRASFNGGRQAILKSTVPGARN